MPDTWETLLARAKALGFSVELVDAYSRDEDE